MDLVVSIENNFGFKVKPDDFQKMINLQDVYTYSYAKSNRKGGYIMAQWGKSRGNALGYKIFIFLIKHTGVQSAYGLLRLVTLYY
jgi:hypothetical protein